MELLTAWYNAPFWIVFAVGMLLVLGSMVGLLEFELDIDHDHDTGHGHEGVGSGEPIDVGRVPLTVVVMVGALIFGLAGIVSNRLLAGALEGPSTYFWISLVIAFVAMFTLGKYAVRGLRKVMPKTESYNVSQAHFTGCEGTVTSEATAESGYMDVLDHDSNWHAVRCRSRGESIPRGTRVLVLEFDYDAECCVVQAMSETEQELQPV